MDSEAQRRQLVIVVPGIRDRGVAWTNVQHELELAGFTVVIAGWSEYFGVLPFLVPAPFYRRAAMARLSRRIRDAIQHNTVNGLQPAVSYIAHSFGSYILCFLLRREYHLKTKRLILCGSVLPRSFKFSSFEERFEPPVINEVGRKDRWPLIASCVTFGYGTIGTYGYAGAPVLDRFHTGAGHGHFSTVGFATKYWVPFLRASMRGGIVPGDPPEGQSSLAATFTRALQLAKWPILGMLLWLLFGTTANGICDRRIRAINALQWEQGSFAWLSTAIAEERGRLKAQNESVCAIVSDRWPIRTTIVKFDERLTRIVACGSEASVSVKAPAARDALQLLAKSFPSCISLAKLSPDQFELTLNEASGAVKRLQVAPDEAWQVCGCSPKWDEYLVNQRTLREANR